MSDTPDTPAAAQQAQPVPVRLSGGWHPDLGIPGLFLGQGTHEALRYPDGHLELVGVTLPPALLANTLASAAAQQSGPQNIASGAATEAPAASDPPAALVVPPAPDEAPESPHSAPDGEDEAAEPEPEPAHNDDDGALGAPTDDEEHEENA